MIKLSDIQATFRKSGPQNPAVPQTAHRQGVPSASSVTPHAHAPQPAIPSSDWAEQRQRAQEEHDLRRRRSQKPVDHNIPPGVVDLANSEDDAGRYSPLKEGVQQYSKLRDVERKLDAVMTRKRLDAHDFAPARGGEQGTMRIWISNTVEGQPWQITNGGIDTDTFDFGSNVEASFRVKIEGRLISNPSEDGQEDSEDAKKHKDGDTEMGDDTSDQPAAKRPRLSSTAGAPGQKSKLSHFFKTISIDFDRAPTLQPDQYTRIQWQRPDTMAQPLGDQTKGADFDCLEFQRKSDENINITVNLTRDEEPARYKLAPQLAEVLDMEEGDRQTVLMGVWEYVRANGLADEGGEGRNVRCDPRLRRVSPPWRIPFNSYPQRPRRADKHPTRRRSTPTNSPSPTCPN